MKRIFRIKWLVFFVLLLGLAVYLFRGPLFPWNPFKIGYTKIQGEHATVYIHGVTERDSVVYHIDELLQEEEQFHGLAYQKELTIIVVDENDDMKRFLPWLRGSGYSVSLSLADVVYIGPTARRSRDGIEPFLRHECSHLLLGQNTSFANARKIHQHGWLAEGVAEVFSGHRFYTRAEFAERVRRHPDLVRALITKNPLQQSVQEIRINYTFYRLFIEYVINTYGMEKFQEYLNAYIEDPDAYRGLFMQTFGAELDPVLNEFAAEFVP